MNQGQSHLRVAVGLAVSSLLLVLLAGTAIALRGPLWSRAGDPSAVPAKRSSSAIAITTDGTTLLVVNPDSNSLTVVDTVGRTIVAEIPVGTDPRTVAVDEAGGRAYVASYGSDSVAAVDINTQQVVTEVVVGDRPYGVLVSPDSTRLYVAEQGADRLSVIDTAALQILYSVPLPDRPSGLALSDDGRTLYITHLLENTISVLDLGRPFALYLPLISKGVPLGGPWVAAAHQTTHVGAPAATYASTTYRLTNCQSTDIPLFADSNLVQSIVLSPDGRIAYLPHTRSNSSNPALTFDTTVFPLVSLVDLETLQHLVGQQIDLGTLDPPGVGLPFDAVVAGDGQELWVLNAASNDISVIDLANRRLVAHIEVGDNPRGIVLSPDGATAYVNNTLAGTVSVIDTAAYSVTGSITVTSIPLPPALLNGKRLFHSSDDPRMAQAQWIACSSCHYEGEHDGRTWQFGFAGPRNTTGLLGMVETYPLRWSGEWDESADSEYVVRKENFGSGLIVGELNCTLFPPDCIHHPPNQGRSYDLDCLAAFLDSLQVRLSPAHEHGEPLSEAELRGQALFLRPDLGCVPCHPPPLYTDLQKHDVGTTTPDEKIGPAYDTPTLRGLFDSAPYFHDGSAATLYACLTRPTPGNEHDLSGRLTEEEIRDLVAFLRALPFTR